MSIMKEFREFAIKGNMVDMAVGIIIGTAFGKIVSSLVNDVIMPPLGFLIGGVDFTELKILMKAATVDEAGNAVSAVTLNYGTFVQTFVDFLIVAFTIFLVVKAINMMKKKQEAAPPPPPPAPSKEEQLLSEIRDLLKK
jgi:large conductance mechanosensitive channel